MAALWTQCEKDLLVMGVLTRDSLPAKYSAWTECEIDFLRTEYSREGVMVVAQALGRSRDTVAAFARRMDLVPGRAFVNWTPELDDFIRDQYDLLSGKTISELLGCSRSAIYARAKHLGLEKSDEGVAEASRRATLARSAFTPEVIATIERLYPSTLTADIAAQLNLSVPSVQSYANGRGWKKSPDFLRSIAKARCGPDHGMRKTQFAKGLIPWNKGQKGLKYPGTERTQFAKGSKPYTWKPIGSLRVTTEGYLERKVTDLGDPPARDWVGVHRLVWIEAKGPVPQGHVVVFKPGRKSTVLEEITLDAIECISRGQLAVRNHPRRRSPELGRLVALKGAMTRAIRKYSKFNAEQAGAAS